MTEIDPRFFIFNIDPANAAVFERAPSTPPFEAVVGEAFEVRAKSTLGSLVLALVSAPVGSTADWSGASFTPDVPGVYVVTAANGAAGPITLVFKAFPAAALTHSIVANVNHEALLQPSTVAAPIVRGMADRKTLLRGIAGGAYGNFADSVFAALTTQQPIPVGLTLR